MKLALGGRLRSKINVTDYIGNSMLVLWCHLSQDLQLYWNAFFLEEILTPGNDALFKINITSESNSKFSYYLSAGIFAQSRVVHGRVGHLRGDIGMNFCKANKQVYIRYVNSRYFLSFLIYSNFNLQYFQTAIYPNTQNKPKFYFPFHLEYGWSMAGIF